MRPRDAVDSLRACCPNLTEEIEKLLGEWLRPVRARLKAISEGVDHRPRAKHVNDPVWATFELEPQEILLIDSPLLQRLRGVKQLGLAHLVFPGANHDRFEHLCGVVNAADRMFRALQANAERRRDAEQRRHADLPTLTDNQRRLVRLAALLHDVGHGPFSHAIEPVVEARYGKELRAFNHHVKATYHLDSTVAIGELISVLVVLSPQMQPVLENSLFSGVGADDVIERQLELATLILGARRHGLPAFLSAIISGQADADKLDYMRRDAHHSGMPIQFDTERLLSKLEIIRCTPDNLPAEQEQNRKFAGDSHAGQYFDVGIAAAGVGALEQMLIGRAFLYDRLYHHHKVRAADAMAQRLLHYAKQERGGGFDLSDLYLTVSDDVMVRLLGGSLSQLGFQSGGERAASLAQRILMRDLYVRAFAFRASFHPMVEAVKDEKDRESARAEVWAPVSTALSDVADRINAEEAIVELAKQLAPKTGDDRLMHMARELHPSHVIVDLAENRVRPVIINVHAEDGSLEVPNLFFDPARWSNVYDLQKRTGYVFCAREFVPLVALATKKYFFETWGYVVSEKADRLTKTSNALTPELIDRLLQEGAIDDTFASVLKRSRTTRTFLRKGQVSWPKDWANESADFERDLLDDLRTHLPYGFSVDERQALCDTLGGVASFIDTAHKSRSFLTSALSESDIQMALAEHLRARELKVTEGAKLSGGETDLIVSDRIVVENKIVRDVTDPFAVKPDSPYQANRYATAIASRVYVVLTGYMPKGGAELLGMTQSIRAEKVPDLARAAVVIRAVVPYGQPPPSHEKRPPSDKRPLAGT
jgi:HD superfamily phosphohydrolase